MADIVETQIPTTSTKFLTGNMGHGHQSSWTEALANLKDVVNEDVRNLKDITNSDFRNLSGVVEGSRHSTADSFASVRVEAANSDGITRLEVANKASHGVEVSKDLASVAIQQMVSGFKDGRYDAASLTASILAGQVSGFKDARYDSSQAEGRLSGQASANASAMALAFKDAAILSLQNKADSDAKAAECCCELKEKIGSDGQQTRDLMNSIDRERLRDQTERLYDEITYLKGRLVPGTPA